MFNKHHAYIYFEKVDILTITATVIGDKLVLYNYTFYNCFIDITMINCFSQLMKMVYLLYTYVCSLIQHCAYLPIV